MTINDVTIAGRVVRDPELRPLKGGDNSCTFSIALNTRYKDKAGTWKEEVSFISCTAYGNRGEFIAANAEKGARIVVKGNLKQFRWEKDGKKQSKISVVVKEVELLDWPDKSKEKTHAEVCEESLPEQSAIPPSEEIVF